MLQIAELSRPHKFIDRKQFRLVIATNICKKGNKRRTSTSKRLLFQRKSAKEMWFQNCTTIC